MGQIDHPGRHRACVLGGQLLLCGGGFTPLYNPLYICTKSTHTDVYMYVYELAKGTNWELFAFQKESPPGKMTDLEHSSEQVWGREWGSGWKIQRNQADGLVSNETSIDF